MRLTALALLLSGLACGGNDDPWLAAPAAPAPHRGVIVVSIDGLMPDAYLAPDAHGLKVPTLRRIVREGASARGVRSVFPAVTYPAHTTMATGVPPAIHGIGTNRALDPARKNQGGWRWYAEDIKVPTLWQEVERSGRHAALINWPVTVGARVSALVPEYWRAGTAEDQKLLRAMSTPGLLDAVAREFPDLWTQLKPPDIVDAASFDVLIHLVRHALPDLAMMHVWVVDDRQHHEGPWSPAACAAIEEADHQLGRLLDELANLPEARRPILLVVSDHGFRAVSREIRPNVLLAASGLVTAADPASDPAAWRVTVSANGGTALVYLADPTDAALLAQVRTVLAPLTTGADAAVAQTLDADEIAARGGDPGASLALVAAPGASFNDSLEGPAIAPSSGAGDHGYPPDDPAMRASFLAFGPGIDRRDLGDLSMVDVAPTVARLLGLELPAATGHAVELGP